MWLRSALGIPPLKNSSNGDPTTLLDRSFAINSPVTLNQDLATGVAEAASSLTISRLRIEIEFF